MWTEQDQKVRDWGTKSLKELGGSKSAVEMEVQGKKGGGAQLKKNVSSQPRKNPWRFAIAGGEKIDPGWELALNPGKGTGGRKHQGAIL